MSEDRDVNRAFKDFQTLQARLTACAETLTPDVGVATVLRDDVTAYVAAHSSPGTAAFGELAEVLLERAVAYERDPDDLADRTLWVGKALGALRVANAVLAHYAGMG